MSSRRFAWFRFRPLIVKEFLYLIRDPVTFFSVLIIPFLQITLFSLVLNSNPNHLPSTLLTYDHSPFANTLVKSMENTSYFDFFRVAKSEKEANDLLLSGQTQFVLTIPENFSRDLVRGRHPAVLLQADAVNPLTVGNALNTAKQLEGVAFQGTLPGPVAYVQQKQSAAPFTMNIESRYNPSNLLQYSSVPGLIGVVLSVTFMMMTLVSITREKERGTLESLLATPTRPSEVLISKLIPFFAIGMVQLVFVLMEAHWVFHVPFTGNPFLVVFASILFLLASLLTGLLFSAIAKNLFQAMQFSSYFLLPNILFSGFVFPFRGMPFWAQWLGNILPLTHYLRILNNVMIKGGGFLIMMRDLWQIMLFIIVVTVLIKHFYRETLD